MALGVNLARVRPFFVSEALVLRHDKAAAMFAAGAMCADSLRIISHAALISACNTVANVR